MGRKTDRPRGRKDKKEARVSCLLLDPVARFQRVLCTRPVLNSLFPKPKESIYKHRRASRAKSPCSPWKGSIAISKIDSSLQEVRSYHKGYVTSRSSLASGSKSSKSGYAVAEEVQDADRPQSSHLGSRDSGLWKRGRPPLDVCFVIMRKNRWNPFYSFYHISEPYGASVVSVMCQMRSISHAFLNGGPRVRQQIPDFAASMRTKSSSGMAYLRIKNGVPRARLNGGSCQGPFGAKDQTLRPAALVPRSHFIHVSASFVSELAKEVTRPVDDKDTYRMRKGKSKGIPQGYSLDKRNRIKSKRLLPHDQLEGAEVRGRAFWLLSYSSTEQHPTTPVLLVIKESPVASEKCLGEGLGLSKIGTLKPLHGRYANTGVEDLDGTQSNHKKEYPILIQILSRWMGSMGQDKEKLRTHQSKRKRLLETFYALGWCPFSLLSDSTSELDPLPIRKCVRHSNAFVPDPCNSLSKDRTTSAESHPAAGIGNCGISGFRLLQRRQFIRSRILKPQTLSVNNIEKIRTKELELSSIFNSRKKILRS
ncbi:unnamed protein product [Dovyalis caffra]|uniref:Uncharacterized protein n=1 Tax=Dovyalis caffra TaxID=77055 RepID=A0AAV1R3N7_9ROSI|nr:unnamed protein product [Dovyalis caffra]